MKHYHGTPLGGTRDEAARFVSRIPRHFFVPFPQPEDLPLLLCSAAGFALDNGAFTAWTQGQPITNWQPFYEWVGNLRRVPSFDWAIIPDVIDGTESDNDALVAEWPHGIDGVPVWHLHESLERLDQLVSEWPRVALGSSGQWSTPGAESWWERMACAMGVACDDGGAPRAKLHGLRMLRPDIIERLPLASADSTNVAQNCGLAERFGIYKPPTRSQRAEVIASRIESVHSPAVWMAGPEQRTLFA